MAIKSETDEYDTFFRYGVDWKPDWPKPRGIIRYEPAKKPCCWVFYPDRTKPDWTVAVDGSELPALVATLNGKGVFKMLSI